MNWTEETYYAAISSKDSRFDGEFFVGITSTGIYCRPICSARLPKPENCRYFIHAGSAEEAGFRPCLLCRPELAPGHARVDAAKTLAMQVADMIESENANSIDLTRISNRLGYSSRHIRRTFVQEYGISPQQYRQTRRLLLSKTLLTDTRLSVVDVAMASGFTSLRSFNESFQKSYRMTPTQLRKKTANSIMPTDSIVLSLSYRPPYLWDEFLSFVGARAIPGVDSVTERTYIRMVEVDGKMGQRLSGTVEVTNEPKISALRVKVAQSLLPVLSLVLARVRSFFDLSCSPDAVAEGLREMDHVRPGAFQRGIRIPGAFDPFEIAVRTVIGQQISVRAASTIAGRIANELGASPDRGTRFPSVATLLDLGANVENVLGKLGVTRRRTATIMDLAESIDNGTLNLDGVGDPEEVRAKLMEIKGVGPWTATYIVMRTMSWTDAFLETDYGIKKALAPLSSKCIAEVAKAWAPWRSYASLSLWNSL